MAPELSSNWKKLQVILRTESRNKVIHESPTQLVQRKQNSTAKRKRIEAHRTGVPVSSTENLPKRVRMVNGSDSPRQSTKSELSTSLALWAEDNDISAKDLAQAYGMEVRDAAGQGPRPDEINAGLLEDVDIGQFVAMDCEMVGVGGEEDRSVVARVSLVNFHGVQVYDSFVRPKEFVTDWRTRYSGVSPKNMATARSFDEVRDTVVDLLKNRVLVGHGIRNDLEVMMLGHPKKDIRDTSRFSGFRKLSAGRTPSLKKLAKEVLGMDIQEGQHSSIEDARAAIFLFRQCKQAFEAEATNRFTLHKAKGGQVKSKSKRKKKSKS